MIIIRLGQGWSQKKMWFNSKKKNTLTHYALQSHYIYDPPFNKAFFKKKVNTLMNKQPKQSDPYYTATSLRNHWVKDNSSDIIFYIHTHLYVFLWWRLTNLDHSSRNDQSSWIITSFPSLRHGPWAAFWLVQRYKAYLWLAALKPPFA